jgi:uncharacterized membrane protein
MTVDGKNETVAAASIDAILRLEKEEEQQLAFHHRIFHSIGGFVGTVHFIILQILAVGLWIAFNAYFPGFALDHFPFPLLATILALEAVLLTSCVLIRQNLIDQTLERRDHLELQINLLAEREATRSLRILQRIAERLGVGHCEEGSEDSLAEETSVDQIARDLKAREKREKHQKREGDDGARVD